MTKGKPMTKIIFTEDHQTSFDGITTVDIVSGAQIECTAERAQMYIARGVARLVEGKALPEAKADKGPEENKAHEGAPENKATPEGKKAKGKK